MDDCANAQYPPITAAIRSRVESGWDPWPEAREWLLGKCDTIDAIHARLEAAYDRLRAEGEHDFAPESHYVMLPKDADGEPIHVGDTVTCGRSVWQVTGLRLTGLAWGVCCTIFNDHGGSGTNVYPPCALRHYHAPTVEDVLREVVTLCHNTWKEESAFNFYGVDDVMESGNIAEYAAKLRLAGDGTGGRNEHH